MKIQSSTSTRSAGGTRKASDKGKVSSGEFARALGDGDDDETVSAATSSGSVGAIDALLSVQEMSGDEERGGQAKARAEELLEQLDALRHGLLAGHLSVDKLDHLVALVGSQRAEASDPQLKETLDAIELLARVELAKLGRDV